MYFFKTIFYCALVIVKTLFTLALHMGWRLHTLTKDTMTTVCMYEYRLAGGKRCSVCISVEFWR
jgi:hypothetical protein